MTCPSPTPRSSNHAGAPREAPPGYAPPTGDRDAPPSDLVRRRMRRGKVHGRATFSACGTYRYDLARRWDEAAPRLLFVMLNPSTADAGHDDPTIARCLARARAGGFGAVRVVNLFAFRATHPRDLRRAAEPVGPANDAAILGAARWADRIVCAWGVHGSFRDRDYAVRRLLGHRPLYHLGLTKAGHPRHPLHLPYAAEPGPWQPEPRPKALPSRGRIA